MDGERRQLQQSPRTGVASARRGAATSSPVPAVCWPRGGRASGPPGRGPDPLAVRVGARAGSGGRACRSGPLDGRRGQRHDRRCPPAPPSVRALVVPETPPPRDAGPNRMSYRWTLSIGCLSLGASCTSTCFPVPPSNAAPSRGRKCDVVGEATGNGAILERTTSHP